MNILDVGKYKGKSFEYIEKNDPGYSKWVLSLESPSNKTLLEFSRYLRRRNGNLELNKNANNNNKILNKCEISNNCSYLEVNKNVAPSLIVDCKIKDENFVNGYISNEYITIVKDMKLDLMKNNLCNIKDENFLTNKGNICLIDKIIDKDIAKDDNDMKTILEECDKELNDLISDKTIIVNGLNAILSDKKIKLDFGIVFSLVSPTMFRISSEKNNKSSLTLPKVLGDYLKDYKMKENFTLRKMRSFHTGMQGIDSKPYSSIFIFPGIYYDKLYKNITDNFECKISVIPEFILDRFPDFKKFEIEDYEGDYEKISNLTPKYDPEKITLPDCNMCKGCIYDNICYNSLNYLKNNFQNLFDSLRPFQKVGVLCGLKKEGRILIGDEMGLGKTLQALSIITYFKKEWPVLIICPSSIRFQWYQQSLDWLFPEINKSNITLIRSSNDLYKHKSKIIIISYELITRNQHFRDFFGTDFQVVIADESHFLKNSVAKRTQMIVPLLHRAKRVILLSGTPALNNPTELYEQINAIVKPNPQLYLNKDEKNKEDNKRDQKKLKKDSTFQEKSNRLKKLKIESESESENDKNILFLMKEKKLFENKKFSLNVISPKFPKYLEFAQRYSDIRINKFSHKKEFYGSRNTEELHLFIRESVMIRRLKKQVLHELPPKQRSKIPLEIKDKAGIKKIQELLLDSNFQIDKTELNEDDSNVSNLHKLTCQIKIQPVQEYIEYLLEYNDDKYVIFGHHHVMLDAIESVLLKRRKNGGINNSGPFLFIRIDGKTPGNKREEYVREFQNNNNCKVALLSITACGQGLNLTSAGTVIFAELYWVPGTMLQAEDRCHRIGTQYSCINIHYLIAEDTLDDKMWGTLCRKQKIMASTLDGIDQRKCDTQHFNTK